MTSDSKIPLFLIDAYKAADFHVFSGSSFILKKDQYSEELHQIFVENAVQSAAFITANNPYSNELTNEENIDRNKQLENQLKQMDFEYIPGEGRSRKEDWAEEASFLVLGINKMTSCELGKQFEQNAIVWCDKDAVPRLILLR